MEFVLEPVANGRNKTIALEHKGVRLEWMIEKYRSFTPDIYVFGDINRAMRNLPESAQDELFGVYQQIQDDLLNISQNEKLDKSIRGHLKRIGEILPYDKIAQQVREDGDFWIPPDPKNTEAKVEVNLASFDVESEEEELNEETFVNLLTYSLQDYEHLNTLIIYIKLYFPVLSHYNIIMKDDLDSWFANIQTLALLGETELVRREGFNRLSSYIRHFWTGKRKKEVLNPAVLLKGMSENNVVSWIVAELIIRKLLPIGVSHRGQDIPDEQRPNFIKGLFHNVDEYAKRLTSNPKNEQYKDKSGNGNEIDDAEQSSKLESLRIVQEIESPAIVIMDTFLSDINHLIRRVDPTLDAQRVQDIAYSSRHHLTYNPVRTDIISWVFATGYVGDKDPNDVTVLVAPEMHQYLNNTSREHLHLVAYALLNHWGFDDLATILDARIINDIPRETVFGQTPVSAEQVKALQRLYPHEIESNRVKGESKRNSNYAILRCQELQQSLTGHTLETYNERRRFVCDTALEYRLAELVIFLHENHHLI